MEKNVGDSPYMFTVVLRVNNLGDETLKTLQVEDKIPDILNKKGNISFTRKPEEESDNSTLPAWLTKAVYDGETFEITYSLPLEAELSKPQLNEIEGHFNDQIVSFIGLPENFLSCSDCEGAGSTACQACNSAGSSTCTACGGNGSTVCWSCGGEGRGTCSVCEGDGYYYQCPSDGTIVNGFYDDCPTCGRSWMDMPQRVCSRCNRTGISDCSTCGGNGRVTCRTCSGTGRLICALCQGAGRETCPTCHGAGETAFTYGLSVFFAEQSAGE